MTAPDLTLLMTRPRGASDRFLAQLPNGLRRRFRIVESPLIRIVPCEGQIDTGQARGIIFTSSHAVDACVSGQVDTGLPCFCVGQATTKAARFAGWPAKYMGSTAEELIAKMLVLRPETPLVHLAGVHIRTNIAEVLTASGLPTRSVTVYDQRLEPLESEAEKVLQGDKPVIAPLFSPRTARHFANQLSDPAHVHAVALSKAVAEPLKNMGIRSVTVAQRPNSKDMIAAIEQLLHRLSRVEGAKGAQ